MPFIHSNTFRYLFFTAVLLLAVFILGRDLSPISGKMFTGHDETQAARISEFTYNLDQGKIPPRIAPHFSYGLGYPLFNYYAPFSYWITSGLNTVIRDIPIALKLSYLLAIVTGFTGMFLLLKRFFSFYPAVLGALAYISSPYIAVEIFVRGNLAEMWFLGLLPLGLYTLHSNSKKLILISAVILSALFTSHNILSLLGVGMLIIYSLLIRNKILNLITICIALLMSSYFLIPSIAELHFVNASLIATKTVYTEHFLCLDQIWQSQPGFAGSSAGCENDGMSFMLGKINIILGLAGIALFLFHLYKKNTIQNKSIFILFLITILGSVFLTTEASLYIWKITEKISAIFQFPWRFLAFALFGISIFIAYGADKIPDKFKFTVISTLLIALFFFNYDHFFGQTMSSSEFKNNYISQEYISTVAPYKVAEYLPTTADFGYWNSLQGNKNIVNGTSPVVTGPNHDILILSNEPFKKFFMAKSARPIIANIHYAPYWDIQINNLTYNPEQFDKLGRPFIPVSNEDYDSIAIQYKQTTVEKTGNIITLLTFIILVLFTSTQFRIPWKIKTKKH